jgi:acetyltransferase-like isoleucine patch superfamily enzyme
MPRTVPDDFHAGHLPDNAVLSDFHYIETSYSFLHYRSRRDPGFALGYGASVYKGTMLDLGPEGCVTVGDYALVHGARIICDSLVAIGDYTLISWNVVIMDTYRLPWNALSRRAELEQVATREPRLFNAYQPAAPVHIGKNVWIGFDACILPGVRIGDGAIIGARSVVSEDVPAYSIVVGNPARRIRQLSPPEHAA